jgi:CRP-like cAMP-binding protein
MSVLAGVPRGATVRASQTGAAEVLEITRPALRLLRKLPKFSAMLDSEYRRNGRSATLIALKSNTSLTPELISDLEGVSRFRVFSKGHTLFREGTPIDHIFLINAGWALLTLAAINGVVCRSYVVLLDLKRLREQASGAGHAYCSEVGSSRDISS